MKSLAETSPKAFLKLFPTPVQSTSFTTGKGQVNAAALAANPERAKSGYKASGQSERERTNIYLERLAKFG
jgi:hypothetical protein